MPPVHVHTKQFFTLLFRSRQSHFTDFLTTLAFPLHIADFGHAPYCLTVILIRIVCTRSKHILSIHVAPFLASTPILTSDSFVHTHAQCTHNIGISYINLYIIFPCGIFINIEQFTCNKNQHWQQHHTEHYYNNGCTFPRTFGGQPFAKV